MIVMKIDCILILKHVDFSRCETRAVCGIGSSDRSLLDFVLGVGT